MTTWLEYFVDGLSTQLTEVKQRGEQAIRRDVLVRQFALSDRQAKALGHILEHGSLTIQDFERLGPAVNRRTLKSAYKEFEDRLGQPKSPRGAKTQMVEAAIDNSPGSFSLTQLEDACPGISRDLIRRILRNLQEIGEVECLGRGPGAAWRKKR